MLWQLGVNDEDVPHQYVLHGKRDSKLPWLRYLSPFSAKVTFRKGVLSELCRHFAPELEPLRRLLDVLNCSCCLHAFSWFILSFLSGGMTEFCQKVNGNFACRPRTTVRNYCEGTCWWRSYLHPLCFHHFCLLSRGHIGNSAVWGWQQTGDVVICLHLASTLSALPLSSWVGWLENREDVVSEFWIMTVFPQYSYLQ